MDSPKCIYLQNLAPPTLYFQTHPPCLSYAGKQVQGTRPILGDVSSLSLCGPYVPSSWIPHAYSGDSICLSDLGFFFLNVKAMYLAWVSLNGNQNRTLIRT